MKKMLSNNKGFTFGELLVVVFILLAIVGEVKCIVKAVNCDWDTKTSFKSEAIYTASACLGFGCVVGWINIEDK